MSLYSIIYCSYARPPWMGERTLNAISEVSQRLNAENGVSGILIFSDGTFVQVLEGPTAHVLQLNARIAADRRNERTRVLWHGMIEERRFSDWAMGCFDVTDMSLANSPVDPSIANRNAEAPVWTDKMTSRLVEFYRENRVSGLEPVFSRLRRLT